jgi:molecular chaperone GrpE (heat shock protein)
VLKGRLPIEISTRGAKFADEADQAAELNETAIEELERTAAGLTEAVDRVVADIENLKKRAGDST